jgi:2-succinyl-6-hydroxy-2,4-cyclohexadiene-1-carboxylate synthase
VPADALASTSRGHGERVVLVHGFTQTAHSWDLIARRLARRYEVVSVDAPGHGGSSTIHADLPSAALMLAAAGGPATYVGYSMGGRLCLHLALSRADLVHRLVLVSTTAGIEDPAERAARRRSDDELAASIERDGVDRFLDRWLALPLFATLPRDLASLDDRRRNTAAGLASSLRLAGAGAQASLWDRLGELPMPVLVVAGEHDAKYVAHGRRLADLIPRSTFAVIERAGHSVHLEQPDAFGGVLEAWLSAEGEPERRQRAVDEL